MEDTGSNFRSCSTCSFVKIDCAKKICYSWDASNMVWRAHSGRFYLLRGFPCNFVKAITCMPKPFAVVTVGFFLLFSILVETWSEQRSGICSKSNDESDQLTIIFLRLSSKRTLEKTFRIDEKGRLPRIMPLTSSKLQFTPTINIKPNHSLPSFSAKHNRWDFPTSLHYSDRFLLESYHLIVVISYIAISLLRLP